MSYATQAVMAHDVDLIQRVAACAATQNVNNPEAWSWDRSWKLSATPGWDAAYSYAIAVELEKPGNADNVVTDAMILSAVQPILAAEASPE
jgi:hypothetical protein